MSEIPGITAKHAIITPACIANKTAEGAMEEALGRLRDEFRMCSEAVKVGATFHIVLTVAFPVALEGKETNMKSQWTNEQLKKQAALEDNAFVSSDRMSEEMKAHRRHAFAPDEVEAIEKAIAREEGKEK